MVFGKKFFIKPFSAQSIEPPELTEKYIQKIKHKILTLGPLGGPANFIYLVIRKVLILKCKLILYHVNHKMYLMQSHIA